MRRLFLRLRAWVTMVCAMIMNLGAFGVKARGVCAPTYNCPGCPWSAFGCPMGTSAYQFYLGKFPWFALGGIALIGALTGRLVCGYICPFGFFQDCLHKIPGKKYKHPRWMRYIKYAVLLLLILIFPLFMGLQSLKCVPYIDISDLKIKTNPESVDYSVKIENKSGCAVCNPRIDFKFIYDDKKKPPELASFQTINTSIESGESRELVFRYAKKSKDVNYKLSVSSPQSLPEQYLSIPYLYYCKICPIGTGTATLPTAYSKRSIDLLKKTWFRISIFLVFLIGGILISRLFCRTFCPLGAFYALTSKFAAMGMRIKKDKCIGCGACSRICPMGLNVIKEVGGSECILCGDCRKICPTRAIERTNIFKGTR